MAYYRKLEDHHASFQTTGYLRTVNYGTSHTSWQTITLTGLDSLTVYEVEVAFFKPSTSSSFTRVVPANGCTGDPSSSPPCSNATTYYGITMPAAGAAPIKTARANVVGNALFWYVAFQWEHLASWDDSLRDNFQLAARNSSYGSEFYATAAVGSLKDMNPCKYVSGTPWCWETETSPAESYVGALKTWFSNPSYPNSFALFDTDPTVTDIKPADWLGVNPNADNPDGQRTQLFLAYDSTTKEYWYAEGNVSVDSAWGPRTHAINVASHGLCDDASGTYCPSGATTTCSSGCYWVKSVGKVNNADMMD
jgi:hypothetical protein